MTLNEAYTYAFEETLASTEKTQYGPQHPAYDIDLSGPATWSSPTSVRSAATSGREGRGRSIVRMRDAEGNLALSSRARPGGLESELGLGARNSTAWPWTLRRPASRVTFASPAVGAGGDHPCQSPLRAAGPVRISRGVDRDMAGRPPRQEADSPDSAAAIGAAVGEIVGSTIGKAMGTAVNAAITAAAGASCSAPPDPSEDSAAVGDSSVDRPPRTKVFQLGFFPDFSRGVFSSRVDHVVAVNVLAGSSGSSYGFEIGGLANFESADVVGFQAAGLGNAAQGTMTGYQAAGLVNYVGGGVRFFQSAGLVNIGGSLVGGQMAGLGDVVVETTIGAQGAGLFNWSGGEVQGAQVAGLGTGPAAGSPAHRSPCCQLGDDGEGTADQCPEHRGHRLGRAGRRDQHRAARFGGPGRRRQYFRGHRRGPHRNGFHRSERAACARPLGGPRRRVVCRTVTGHGAFLLRVQRRMDGGFRPCPLVVRRRAGRPGQHRPCIRRFRPVHGGAEAGHDRLGLFRARFPVSSGARGARVPLSWTGLRWKQVSPFAPSYPRSRRPCRGPIRPGRSCSRRSSSVCTSGHNTKLAFRAIAEEVP